MRRLSRAVGSPVGNSVERPVESPSDTSVVRRALARDVLRDVAVVLIWFVGIGLLCAVVWWKVTPLAEFTRTTDNAQMGEGELGRQVSSDGWYFTVAALGGLISGIVLLATRRSNPVVLVVLVTIGAGLASWLMARVGLWLGPPDPGSVLAHVPVGDKVPIQLQTHADGVRFVWPIAALVGALGVLWGLDDNRQHAAGTTLPEAGSGPQTSG